MENTLKIKSISKPDPRGAYPSERRYSASMVMGLAMIHLAFSVISTIFVVLAVVVEKYIIPPTLCLSGCSIAGVFGILASRRWYIDNTIKWFFLMSLISTITSCIAIALAIEVYLPWDNLHVNILICSSACTLWSLISAIVSYKGMHNTYPDDIIIPKGKGKVEVCTKHKGNKNAKIMPPDILSHFKISDGRLPKAESYSEYMERVHKYLDDK